MRLSIILICATWIYTSHQPVRTIIEFDMDCKRQVLCDRLEQSIMEEKE